MKRIKTKTRWIIIIDGMIMCRKYQPIRVWRIAVVFPVALMIINNMVFTILLRQRKRIFCTQRHELGHGLFHLEMNIIIAP